MMIIKCAIAFMEVSETIIHRGVKPILFFFHFDVPSRIKSLYTVYQFDAA